MEAQQPIRRAALCAALLGVTALTLGCASYSPKPLHPDDMLAQLQQRRLTDAVVLERVRSASGAEPPIHWDRAELLVAALELNPAVSKARAQLLQTTAGARTARALQNPNVSLASEYDLSHAGEPLWLWGISTSFLLDTFVSRQLRTHLAEAGVRGAHADFSDTLWSVRRDLRGALLGAVASQRRIELLEADARQRADLSRLARSRIEAGEAARAEGLQADLEWARSRGALEDARHTREAARAKLAAALGISVRALDDIVFSWDGLDSLAPFGDDALRAARERALLSRPDLERAIADYDTRELELRQQTSAQYLQTSLGPGFTWDHGVRKATFGASIAVPIFNRNQGPIAEALAAREVAGQHAILVQSTILNEIEGASAAYTAALGALDRAHTQREASDALASSARRAFALDASDQPTLLAAEVTATTERLLELDALERAQQALGLLEDAVRAPLAGPELNLRILQSLPEQRSEAP